MKVSKMPPTPCVMGIINVTPDSFYEASRVQEQSVLRERVRQILDEGGAIIDVGAYSTRPGALDISAEAEMERLRWALPIVVDEAEKWHNEHDGKGPKPLISVDTFRAAVAERCVTELGADIINDISGGTLDEKMFDVVARTRPIYILMHSRGTPQDMQQRTDYADGVVDEVIRFAKADVAKLDAPAEDAVIVTNLPYGVRIGSTPEIDRIYEVLREKLAEHPGWSLFAITPDKTIEEKMQRRADRRRKLYNGNIETTFYQFHGKRRKC